jgi:crotonobetainyl-CoA:carnitine CoA-transferase CaiB-like acyl-CoA transferase
MSGPLHGVTILDFTQLLQGPYATMMLGDLGAEIIKVEPPTGDWMRKFSSSNLYLGGESVSFMAFNRNKRSLTINLKHAQGIDVIKRLVGNADVVIENFRPGVMDRLGIGYETLKAINPRLIYCASSGFGQTGPYVKRPGQDLLIQSMTGLPYLNGRRDDPPVAAGFGIADISACLHIVYGVLAALFSRERTGCGQRVDVNLYNSLLTFVNQDISTYLNGGGLPVRPNSGNNPAPYNGAPYGLYPTTDGYIAIAMNPVNKLAALLGLEGYEHLNSNNVLENRDDINRAFSDAFRQRSTQAWLEILLAEDIWCAPVYTFEDVERDPQVAENHMIISFEHPTAGIVRTMGIPVKFDGTPGGIRYPSPLLGQHTAELLQEFGSYSAEDIAAMQGRGVIGAST